MPEFNVKVTGRLLKGYPKPVINAALDEMKEAVAQEGYNMVRQRLSNVLRNPTGYYESRIATDNAGDNPRIHDSNVIYGPWLEGTSARNQATRFKGYHTFRKVKAALDRKKKSIIQPIADRLVRELQR